MEVSVQNVLHMLISELQPLTESKNNKKAKKENVQCQWSHLLP